MDKSVVLIALKGISSTLIKKGLSCVVGVRIGRWDICLSLETAQVVFCCVESIGGAFNFLG